MTKSLSQLEDFLQAQSADGRSEGEGRFTLDRDEAIGKLAKFQLPFAGAWIVKVVQSLVASGLRAPIMVEQSRCVTTIRCPGGLEWGLAELEAALITPEPHESRAVNHLVAALRMVGLSEKRGFEICLPDSGEVLLWDGASLHNIPRGIGYELVLTVTHNSPTASATWFEDQVSATRRNAEVAAALRDYCFTCPLPLSLDNRRVDGLQRCPDQGWSNRSFPLTLTFLEGSRTTLEWPPGTFEAGRSGNLLADGGGLQEYSKALFSNRQQPPPSELAVLLTAHAGPHSEIVPGTRNSATVWKFEPAPSRCHWIQDGVRIQVEQLPIPPCGISAALFLSADGLQSDLSEFSLHQNEKLRQRLRTACKLAQEPVGALTKISKAPLVSHNKKRYMLASNAIVAASIGVAWFMGSSGLAAMAIPIGCVGFLIRFAERDGQKSLVADLGQNATLLARNWRVLRATAPSAALTDPSPRPVKASKARKSSGRTRKPGGR